MQALERTIGQILTETLCYTIPAYQRPYSWNQDNVQELLDDIEEAFAAGDPEYFIGSLITIERERNAQYEVVDGQQRLTTLNLIFASLRNHIEGDAAKQELGNRIRPSNPLTKQTETPRLLLRKSDRMFFQQHVLEAAPLDADSVNELDEPKAHLYANLQVIDKFLTDREQDWMKLFANFVLQKVYIVLVTTESFKSAYRLFNVLNDRGLSLSNSDLIKNRLFALTSDESESETLEQKWVELESITGIDRLDTFLGYHRTAVTAARARKSLAEEYSAILGAEGSTPASFVDSLAKSAKNYQRIIGNDFGDATVKRSIAALGRVSYDEWVPALLAFLNKPVPDLELSEFSLLMEKITMQNWIRRLGRAARLTVYFKLISAINSGMDAEAVREIFLKGANDEEFFALLGGSVYGLPSAKAILLRLEEGCQDESVTKEYSGLITIEHILPQKPTEEYWKSRFTETDHAQWLHRLGNLTLLSGRKNPAAKNYDFDRKKTVYLKKQEKCSFDLTKEVCEEEQWTLDVVQARQNRLMDNARAIWSMT